MIPVISILHISRMTHISRDLLVFYMNLWYVCVSVYTQAFSYTCVDFNRSNLETLNMHKNLPKKEVAF